MGMDVSLRGVYGVRVEWESRSGSAVRYNEVTGEPYEAEVEERVLVAIGETGLRQALPELPDDAYEDHLRGSEAGPIYLGIQLFNVSQGRDGDTGVEWSWIHSQVTGETIRQAEELFTRCRVPFAPKMYVYTDFSY